MFESLPSPGVALLVAPAGSGKSVLMSDWVDDREACWVALTATHNDPTRLAADLTEALHRSHPSFDTAVARLVAPGGERLGDLFLDAVTAELRDMGEPVLLVLDDLHHVSDPPVLGDLSRLLRELPDTVQAVVSSRWDLPLGLGQMRLEGSMLELRSADLAFDQSEAVQLLELTSRKEIGAAQAAALLARTDGWAAGLQLAALSLINVTDIDAFIAQFSGDDRLVVDYLSSRILHDLDPPTRSFLLHTSVLDWLTPALCTAVTGDQNARSTLRTLVDHGLFLNRTTDGADRFRYHPLFADLLRYQLTATDPAGEVECRRRAATWLLEHHEYAAGVEQLLAVGDHDHALEVLALKGHHLFERGEISTLVRLLSQIEREQHQPPPLVSIHLLAAQVAADEFTRASDNHRHLQSRGDLTPGERVAADSIALSLAYSHLPLSEMRRLAESIIAMLPDIEPSTVPDFLGLGGADTCEVMSGFALSLASFLEGDAVSCNGTLEHTLTLPGFRYPVWRIIGLGLLALSKASSGHLTEAQGYALSALKTARDTDMMEHISAAWAHLALAAIHDERLDLDTAALHLEAVGSSIDRRRRPLFDEILHLQTVRHAVLTGGPESALALLRDAPLRQVHRPVFERARSTLEIQLLVRTGAVREALHKANSSPLRIPTARIDALVANGDTRAARSILDEWTPAVSDLCECIEHGLRQAVVTQQEGSSGLAGTLVAHVALQADTEGLLRPFLDAPLALGLLRTATPTRHLTKVRKLLEDIWSPDVRHGSDQLIEQLTPREMIVLAYLPTRLGNEQIAQALFVSVNTLKTHLRNIYRKLDTPGRDAAVERATALGLI